MTCSIDIAMVRDVDRRRWFRQGNGLPATVLQRVIFTAIKFHRGPGNIWVCFYVFRLTVPSWLLYMT